MDQSAIQLELEPGIGVQLKRLPARSLVQDHELPLLIDPSLEGDDDFGVLKLGGLFLETLEGEPLNRIDFALRFRPEVEVSLHVLHDVKGRQLALLALYHVPFVHLPLYVVAHLLPHFPDGTLHSALPLVGLAFRETEEALVLNVVDEQDPVHFRVEQDSSERGDGGIESVEAGLERSQFDPNGRTEGDQLLAELLVLVVRVDLFGGLFDEVDVVPGGELHVGPDALELQLALRQVDYKANCYILNYLALVLFMVNHQMDEQSQELDNRLRLLDQLKELAAVIPKVKLALALSLTVEEYRRSQVVYYQQEVGQFIYFNQQGIIELSCSYIRESDSAELALRKTLAVAQINKKLGKVSDSKVVKRVGKQPFGLQLLIDQVYRTRATCKTNGYFYKLKIQSVREAISLGCQPELLSSRIIFQNQTVKERITRTEDPVESSRKKSPIRKIYEISRRTDNFQLVNTQIVNMQNSCKQLRLFCNQSMNKSGSLSARKVIKSVRSCSSQRLSQMRRQRAQEQSKDLSKSIKISHARKNKQLEPINKRQVLFILKNLYGL